MFEYEDAKRGQARAAFPAAEDDARARARRALQDAYDWRDDEPRQAPGSTAAHTAPAPPPAQDGRSERSAARRSRRASARSTSRTVGV
jgi:hypothetical protein